MLMFPPLTQNQLPVFAPSLSEGEADIVRRLRGVGGILAATPRCSLAQLPQLGAEVLPAPLPEKIEEGHVPLCLAHATDPLAFSWFLDLPSPIGTGPRCSLPH